MTETFRFSLPNGLRVVHSYNPTSSMAVVNTLYNVGGRDESPDHTGIAHLFEHLMFGGSINIPSFDDPLQAAGGTSNAWTSNDFTCFHNIIPAHNIETVFWLESDRMLSPAFSDKALEVQRSVVVEEFKEVCLNRPYGDMGHKLFAMCYPDHPYGIPVIGRDFHDIEKTTQEDARRWFFSHYAPNNAVLSVVGNVKPDKLRSLVEKWYADIPRREIAPRNYADPALPTAPRLVETSGNVPQTAITIAFPMGGYKSEGYVPADLITDILANGQSSRFYRRLLMPGQHFADIDASILGTEHPGLLMVNAKLLHKGQEAEKAALDAIYAELHQLTTAEVDADELSRCVNRLESERVFAMMNPLTKAQALAQAEMHDESISDILPRYHAVAPACLHHYAAQILDPNRAMTLIYRPQ
jgi:predicted Zn-dependent peptidase